MAWAAKQGDDRHKLEALWVTWGADRIDTELGHVHIVKRRLGLGLEDQDLAGEGIVFGEVRRVDSLRPCNEPTQGGDVRVLSSAAHVFESVGEPVVATQM